MNLKSKIEMFQKQFYTTPTASEIIAEQQRRLALTSEVLSLLIDAYGSDETELWNLAKDTLVALKDES